MLLSGVPEDKLHRLVSDYVRENGALKELPRPDKVPPGISGGGGLYSTAEDYAKFLPFVLNGGVGSNGRLLNEVSIDAMTQNQIGELFVEQQPAVHPEAFLAFPLGAGRDKFGFGFQIRASIDEPGMRSPGSLSWGGMMNTHFWVDRKKAIAAVMLTHVLPYYDDGCIHVLQGFEERVYRNLN